MDAYELRKHLGNVVVELLSEILAEIKALRQDYAEGQVAYAVADEQIILSDIGSIEFNKSYEG